MKFLICAPPYTDKSSGIVVLHELHESLVKIGVDAHLAIFVPHTQTETRYYGPADITDILENGIVVYPEVITGNPLRAKRVVRYFLNREGAASGNPVNAGENDFILAFSLLFHKNPHAVLTKENHNPVFNEEGALPWEERTVDCTYIGKGSFYAECKVIEGTIEITRKWPETKQELADLLKKTRFVYMYDNLTAMTTDTVRCGAIPIFLMAYPISMEELNNNYYGKVPAAILSDNGVIIPEDYYQTRQHYLSTIDYVAAQHSKILGEVVEKIKNHFQNA